MLERIDTNNFCKISAHIVLPGLIDEVLEPGVIEGKSSVLATRVEEMLINLGDISNPGNGSVVLI